MRRCPYRNRQQRLQFSSVSVGKSPCKGSRNDSNHALDAFAGGRLLFMTSSLGLDSQCSVAPDVLFPLGRKYGFTLSIENRVFHPSTSIKTALFLF